jgi:outer membrane protein
MRRIQVLAVCVFVLAMLAVPYRAFAFLGLEAGVGYWNQSPSGTLSYKGTTIADELDLKDDLNYKSKSNLFVRVKVELPLILPNIYFMATPMSFDGTGSKNVNFNYGGQTFTANVPFTSKVKLDHYDLALFYPVPLLKTATLGVLNVDLGLNARNINFEGTVTQGTLNASKSLSVYLPMVYAGVQVKPISLFAIEGEFRGIAIGQNHYYDYIAKLRINPIPVVYISGGYRSEDVKIDQSDVKANVKFSGPFVEAGVSF